MAAPLYKDRLIALATRHGKERVLTRAFRHGLGARITPVEAFDTDSLGTFSGERPRPGPPQEVCRLKAERGIEVAGLTVGVASEGSFGPHPQIPFLPVGWEWITFVDRGRGWVISETAMSARTNFSHQLCRDPYGLDAWLQRVGFPCHALIVRPHRFDGPWPVVKGIRDPDVLAGAITTAAAASADGQALVETDMRAHMNPTRMATIRALAFRLVRRIASPCPACEAPGWGRIGTIPGLPCGWCGGATELIHREIHGCQACGHSRERSRRDGLTVADPGHCPRCNP